MPKERKKDDAATNKTKSKKKDNDLEVINFCTSEVRGKFSVQWFFKS